MKDCGGTPCSTVKRQEEQRGKKRQKQEHEEASSERGLAVGASVKEKTALKASFQAALTDCLAVD